MTILNLSTTVILSHFIHGVAEYVNMIQVQEFLSPEGNVLESSQGGLTSIHISCF